MLSPPLFLLLLHLLVYMLHQIEEHGGDQFRPFVNGRTPGGADALTTGAVMVIDLPVVWGVSRIALCTGRRYGAGYGVVRALVQ